MTFGETDPSADFRGRDSAIRRPRSNQVTFDRRELDRILGLYGRMVAAGEWRDYAIDFLKDRAVFSVFRRSSEVPIYRIEKNPSLARRQGAYSVVSATGLIVRRGHELDRVLRVLDKAAEPGCGVAVIRRQSGCAASVSRPVPSARCIITLSSQRPNLKPTFSNVPTMRKPAARCSSIDGALRRIADHREHLAEAAALRLLDQRVEQRAADAAALRLRRRRRSNPRR